MMDMTDWATEPKKVATVRAIADIEANGETCRVEMHFKNGKLAEANKFYSLTKTAD